ncbi:3-keto-disaccharide hydrolase [Fuerstiella marisgermanici]|uniref:3-keto-alpha-glucoside-1,2-lyase/3-keto-2-hydroxy-glucal hydratase domain-containing protein n=1 Tax=Fuerstiella marisgermanici TaxID=1891926 RepID=A0A1P8WFV6_9PLAN|nr:DUF1080 domain-containing protein [Fuerstiella marisgermanici]APZ92923.1 hypothetical protein Fuma_02535 [Fuerstiella marisgermanici]
MRICLSLLAVCCTCSVSFAEDGKPQSNSDAVEFTPLFDGTTLDGWEGDSRFWRAENGVLIGQTTKDVTTKKNTFLVMAKKEYGDFELRFSYRVNGGNSGVQYRSQLVSKWVVKGLQADFEDKIHDGKDRFSGMFFEENGRMFLGQRGDVVVVRTNKENSKNPHIEKIATVGSNEALEKHIRRDDWNDYIVIAKGNVSMHIINGHVMSVGIDEDEQNAKKSGLIAWQLHAGPPLKIEMKNIRIRELK